MGLIAHNYDFFVEWVASLLIGVFVADAFDQLDHRKDAVFILDSEG